jgi:stage II sporulation protein D
MIDKGIILINELDIENYVKYVVPSEVPGWFEKEAIKAQAVLARSRAIADVLKGPKDNFYGAHCDDSTKSQVFNNKEISEIVEKAVEETQGQIMFVNGYPVETVVYFSTSCGFTSNNEEVWSDEQGNFPGAVIPYLRSKPQFGKLLVENKNEEFWNKFFRAFWGIEKELCDFYDRESPWFRWKVTMTREELENVISKGLIAREKADQLLGVDAIRTLQGIPVDINNANFSIGELKDLKIVRRGEGGIVMTLRIVSENGIYEIDKEYNIRFIIRPTKSLTGFNRDIIIERHDGSTYSNYSILPSGYFVFDIDRENGKIKQVTFYGGGNGHGVGMSQYGANYLAKIGKNYQQILKTFYEGKIENIF